MTLHEFAEQAGRLTPQFIRVMMRAEKNLLARGEITLPQLWALLHLADHGDCRMHDLARGLGVTPPTTTNLVDRLVRMKLAARRRRAGDRRAVLVGLTAKGQQVIEGMRAEKKQVLAQLFAVVTETERRAYLHILQNIVSAWEAGKL